MAIRLQTALLLIGIFGSCGATYQTQNFLVDAPNRQIAEQIGKWAEHYRREKAIEWIGAEMPPWSEPCPLKVTVTAQGAGGATSFSFGGGHVWQTMHIEGPVDRLVASVLPHEITHTVFAHYFRRPVPRWADEGGSVLSEDDVERNRHDMMVRQILNAGRAIPLSRLFALREYPRDVGALYAEGYSVANYLVSISNRRTFLEFIAYGMQYGWENAARTVYRFGSVNELEQSWLEDLRRTKKQPPQSAALASRNTPKTPASQQGRVVVRLTAPPIEPLEEVAKPLVRARSSDVESASGWSDVPRRTMSRPTAPAYRSSPIRESGSNESPVRLGLPEFESVNGPADQPFRSAAAPARFSR